MTLPRKIVPTFFLKKGTRLQANSVKVEQNKGGTTHFFLLDFLQYQHILSSINSIQNAKNFLRTVSIQQPNFFSANVLQITCWKTSIRDFSILVRTSAELNKLAYVIYKSRTAG